MRESRALAKAKWPDQLGGLEVGTLEPVPQLQSSGPRGPMGWGSEVEGGAAQHLGFLSLRIFTQLVWNKHG